VTLLVVDVAIWVACGVVTGFVLARRDWTTLAPPGPFTRLRGFDRRSIYERALRVRAWKDALPEAGTWFGGISKRHLPSRPDGYLRRFTAESLRAERVHLVLLLVIPVTMTWNRGWWMLGNVVFGVVINVPCIIVARYNRVRLTQLSRS
jgi:glycosyl-4,4'-diaponeurosporenoate acyltransferase